MNLLIPILLISLFPLVGEAAYAPQANTAGVGVTTLSDITNLKVLWAYASGATNVRASFVNTNFGSSGYQVPTGKTFKVVVAECNTQSTASVSSVSFGYSDTDRGINASSAFSNPIFMGSGSTTAYDNLIFQNSYVGQRTQIAFGKNGFNIPASKYPMMQTNGNSGVSYYCYLYGYEE